jgi:hypothetical protein
LTHGLPLRTAGSIEMCSFQFTNLILLRPVRQGTTSSVTALGTQSVERFDDQPQAARPELSITRNRPAPIGGCIALLYASLRKLARYKTIQADA